MDYRLRLNWNWCTAYCLGNVWCVGKDWILIMDKPFKDMTLEELEAEHKYWDDKIVNATSWGGALTAADEFRRDCARHIRLRKLEFNIMDAG